jgi:hypothetical protein
MGGRAKAKGQVYDLPFLAGGDAGNRTRVRRIRLWVCYKHSRSFISRLGSPQATGYYQDQPMILGSRYRRRASRTLVFMTPTSEVPGGPRGGRDAGLERQGLLTTAYAAIGRAARFGLLAVIVLPSFNEVQAPRLATQSQPSPSKPIIPICVPIIPRFARNFKSILDRARRSAPARRAGTAQPCQERDPGCRGPAAPARRRRRSGQPGR